jgi:hypothetical protein
MSPVSRGRKKKRPTTRPPSARRVLPGLDGVHAELLDTFRPAVRATDPLEVEVLTSDVLGSWWKRLPPGEDPDAIFGEGAIGHAARAGTREAMALLRALAVLGVTPAQREMASSAAAALAAAGVADPPWAATIGQVEVGACWRLSDVFGDQASLLSVFGYGSREHGLVALVDFNHLGGWVKDLFVTPEPATVLRELRKTALSEPSAVLDQVDPAEARRLLEDGLAATDATWEPEVSDELRQFRALALARCRAMPEPDRPAQPVPEIDSAERDAIVAEFLASPHTGALPEEAARYGARLLVDFGADYDAGKPLRVSPAKIAGFLLDWVPAKVILDDADRDALPHVVTAWVRWAGERTGLDPAAVAQLVDVARDCGEEFGEAYEEGADASPIRQFLHGLDTGGGLADAQDALDRRMFAMPYFGTRIGEEDYPRLDPGDPDERRLLIEGEHPEYHAVLEDPGFDGEIDGVNPGCTSPSTRLSPTSYGRTTRLRRGVPPGGCTTPASTATTCSTSSAASSQRTCTARSPTSEPSTVRPTGRRSTRSDHRRPGATPTPPSHLSRARHIRSRSLCMEPSRRSGGGCACPPQPPWRSCTRSSRWRSAGRTPTCTPSRSAVAATPGPSSNCGTRLPTKARPGCRTWPRVPAPGCGTPTTSATPGSTTSSSKTSCRLTWYRTPSASPAGAPARPRTAAACGALPSSATSLPTRAILIALNGSNGSGIRMTRPPSTRTRSIGRWRGFGSADRLSPPGYARCQPSPKKPRSFAPYRQVERRFEWEIGEWEARRLTA